MIQDKFSATQNAQSQKKVNQLNRVNLQKEISNLSFSVSSSEKVATKSLNGEIQKYNATKTTLAKQLASQLNLVTLQKTFQLPKQEIQTTLNSLDFPGIIYGNISNASTIYTMDRFNTIRGHGFAAENANHLIDKLQLRNATIEGTNLKKHGADRIVDGIEIQTKYCNSASNTISECFENGRFKYIASNGEPMQIEVPSDQYEGSIQAMKNRISRGEVPGVTDINDAEKIVRKGHFTYEQVRNIAKFGTVESLMYDATNGAIIGLSSFGITATISFAVAIWNGEDFEVALEGAIVAGVRVGGITFVSSILASQLARTSVNGALVGTTDYIINAIGPKASAHLINAFRNGNNIYGAAAMKSASKLLRGNIITGAITVAIMSSFDVVNIFRGRISGSQLFKNVTNTVSGVAGGTAGWVGGAAAGAAIGSFIPIIGNAVGGIVGGLAGAFLGGSGASKVSSAILNEFIEDDANQMVGIIEVEFKELAFNYILNEIEANTIVDLLKDKLNGSTLKNMYSSSNKNYFASNLLTPIIESVVSKRKFIRMPDFSEINKSLRNVLE